MYYQTVVRAGIDVSEIVPEVTETAVILHVPAAKVLDVNIQHDSIRLFDQESGLFSSSGRDKMVTAPAEAEEDVRQTEMVELLD